MLDIPDHLGVDGAQEWARIVPLLQDRGLLDPLNLSTVEAYCAAYGLWRQARAEVKKSGAIVKLPGSDRPVRNPYLDIEVE